MPIPGGLPLHLLRQEFCIENLQEADPANYMNFSWRAVNMDGALTVMILNPLGTPVFSIAISDRPRPEVWKLFSGKMAAGHYPEPPAPWAASIFVERGAVFYEGCTVWLIKMQFALMTLYMDIRERVRAGS